MIDVRGRGGDMEFNYLQRVKVYRLNGEGKWDDKGTGHVSVEFLERSDAVGLVVIDEEDNQTVLVHRISGDDIYRRQEDTIISWTDPEAATDLALSFQETMGCTFIWDQICNVQRSFHFPTVAAGVDGAARPSGDDLEHSETSQDNGGATEALELPPVELSTLPQIAKALGGVSPFDKDKMASIVARDQNYVRKLVDLFRTCEDLEDSEGLHLLFKIVKGIISLNDGHLFDIIFSDEYIMDIVGALEYDPELTTRPSYRTYLKEKAAFKEVVPVRDPATLSKIHQTYRIGYIKDVILPRVLDDQIFATINSIMLFNNVSVVSSLQNDSAFLSELFSRLRSPESSGKSRRDLVFFVQEFCNLSKHLQPGVRGQLFSALVKEGLFDVVGDILKDPEESVRLSGCDVLIVTLNHDATLLRAFLVNQTSHSLFSELVLGMLTQSHCALQAQLLEIMRMLLDSETMDVPQVDKSPFLDIFYEKYMDQMVEVLTSGCPSDDESLTRPSVSPETLGSICELLCLCVQHHRFRIKYYVMRKHVVEEVLRLTRRREKYVVVAAVRFLRTCISLKEEFYYRYIVKNNCFAPVISAFVANGRRYNLLNSVVLELIDYIRKEAIKSLIVHLVETYSSKLESIDYVDTFQNLKLKYDQMLEAPPGFLEGGGSLPSGGVRDHVGLPESRKRKDDRALDKDEEDYFNEDSDEEEDTATAQVRPSSGAHPSKAGVLNNGTGTGQGMISDEEEDTSIAKLKATTPNGVILVHKDIALINVPHRGNMYGLVDYEDEEDDTPVPSGKASPTSPPCPNPTWTPHAEDAKRKSSPASKRQKSGKDSGIELSSDDSGGGRTPPSPQVPGSVEEMTKTSSSRAKIFPCEDSQLPEPCPARKLNHGEESRNGATTSGHGNEVSTSPRLEESQHLCNRNGDDSDFEGMVTNLAGGRCARENGTVVASTGVAVSEREEHGTCDVISGVTQQLNNGGFESEGKSLSGLGSELARAVTPTSPGYSVR